MGGKIKIRKKKTLLWHRYVPQNAVEPQDCHPKNGETQNDVESISELLIGWQKLMTSLWTNQQSENELWRPCCTLLVPELAARCPQRRPAVRCAERAAHRLIRWFIVNVFRRPRTRARAKEKNSKKERNATKKKRIQAARLSSEDEKQTNEYERCATAKENSFEIKKKETDVTHRLRQQQQQRRRHDVGPRITNSANGDENDSSKKRKNKKNRVTKEKNDSPNAASRKPKLCESFLFHWFALPSVFFLAFLR